MRNPLDIMAEGRTLPEGTDTWGMRTVRPDFRSRFDYRWPFPGNWAEAPGPFATTNTAACPLHIGDGICAANTFRGMALGTAHLHLILLVAYDSADVLGTDQYTDTVRVRRAYVVDAIDGALFVRNRCQNADLSYGYFPGITLRHADLRGAALRYAILTGVDLSYANLRGADLQGADLRGASLIGADLTDVLIDEYTEGLDNV